MLVHPGRTIPPPGRIVLIAVHLRDARRMTRRSMRMNGHRVISGQRTIGQPSPHPVPDRNG